MSTKSIAIQQVTALAVEPYAAERRMVEETLIGTDEWKQMDLIDALLEQCPGAVRKLDTFHFFPNQQYVKAVFMPKGMKLTTRIHLPEHPFFILQGACKIWTREEGWIILKAPHIGITPSGTRRAIEILEDCVFATCHLNLDNELDPDKIQERVTYDHRKLRALQ